MAVVFCGFAVAKSHVSGYTLIRNEQQLTPRHFVPVRPVESVLAWIVWHKSAQKPS